MKKNEQSLRALQDNINNINTLVMGVSKGEKRKGQKDSLKN